jgi:hypothetical protein
MKECDFASHGLSLRETITRRDHLYEVRTNLYCASTKDLIAYFSATVRIYNGEQVLNTCSQFIQRNYLTRNQIDAIAQWLCDCALAARWRLTTYTTLVEARP